MLDLSSKIRQAGTGITRASRTPTGGMANKAMDQQLEKVLRDSNKIAGEEMTGLMAGEVKAKLFNGLGEASKEQTPPAAAPVES
jgi:COP9 signalosome complex subunit 5